MGRRVVLSLLSLVAVASCLSPTIPLPPPDAPSIITAGTTPGTWEVYGTCEPGATVTVVDEATNLGVVVINSAGSYHVTLAGTKCDWAWVTQAIEGGEPSAPTYFQLAVTGLGTPDNNPACQ